MSKSKIGIIGAGVMGQALIKGMIESGKFPKNQLWAMDKASPIREKVKSELGVAAEDSGKNHLSDTDVVILCVKPAQAKSALELLRSEGLSQNTVIVSILAGVTVSALEEFSGGSNPVVRAMPNTPAIVQEGVTVVCGGKHASQDHIAQVKGIFESVGLCLELEEIHFDAVTGLSGSGPAYLYLIMEALADGGVRVGLPRKEAIQIIAQTVLGAATMVQKSGHHTAALKDDVTTPAGCTIGALLIMEDGKIRSVLARAVEEASRIAGKLG